MGRGILRAFFVVLLALASIGTSGCSAESEVLPDGCGRMFVVAPEFTADEQDALASTLKRWNAVAIEPFCLRVSDTPGEAESARHGVFRINHGGEYWTKLSESFGGADVIGVHYNSSDQIGIVDSLSAETLELVALHEFGHAHGLGHTEPPSIMCGYVGTATDFTPNDMAECVRAGACLNDAGAAEHSSVTPKDVQISVPQ